MRSIVRWAIRNSPSMNTLMIAILALGVGSFFLLRKETFPKFDIDMVLITVVYPGASPEEVERGICQKIEEAARSIEGLKKVFSVAREGSGFVICEMKGNVDDPQRVLDEIRSAVDRIPNFPPKNAEVPEIKQIVMPSPAVRVAVVSESEEVPQVKPPKDEAERRRRDRAEMQLRMLAEEIHDELRQLPSVSLVDILAARKFQIDVEISESTLRKYGVSLQEVGLLLAKQNLDLPAGTLRTPGRDTAVRGRNQRRTGVEIEKLQAIPGHKNLTFKDVGNVYDGFEDVAMFSTINGQQALCLEVSMNKDEDLLKVVEEVQAYYDVKSANMPPGYKLLLWFDRSNIVKDRLNLLTRNGLTGLILVFLVLSVFLNIRLAFWVALGIPVSVLGACTVMLYADQTINMISMFAFVMGLGIVVDDAIVIGENIYRHRELGKGTVQAAIDGTVEVAPSVISSVLTTIVAFIPLFYVSGVMGKFIAVMPLAVIAMLAISLVESLIILPCHLAHTRRSRETGWHQRFRRHVERGVNWVIQRLYLPALRRGLAQPLVVFSFAIASLCLVVGLINGGFTPFEFMPKLDSNLIQCKIEFVAGSSAAITDEATRSIEAKLRQVSEELAPGKNLVKVVFRTVGSRAAQGPVRGETGGHVGELWVELMPTEHRQPLGERLGRSLTSQEIIRRWRDKVAGEFSGVESLSFSEISFGPGGKPIEFKLVGQDLKQLEKAAQKAVEYLQGSELLGGAGVFDVSHDNRKGKLEHQFKKNDRVGSINITDQDIYQDVRARIYGFEVMRLQRGRHEVKLMVRNPPHERRSFGGLIDKEISLPGGDRISISQVADHVFTRSSAEINRLNQQRSITVSADVDTDRAGVTADAIVTDYKDKFIPQLRKEFPGVDVRWEGQRQARNESLTSLFYGFIVAVLVMFVLLTVEFRSYIQPLIILAAIPFGLVGAVLGHLAMGLTFTMFSAFGLVALAGVVANDSIVLVDFINHRRREGMRLKDALLDAGAKRFRPVMLTSITTVAGLAPIMLERSLQAQVLIPMAVSVAAGLMMATVWVLFLVPAMYLAHVRSLAFSLRMIVFIRRAYRRTSYRSSAPPGSPSISTAAEHPSVVSDVDGNGSPQRRSGSASPDGRNGDNESKKAPEKKI